MARIRGFEIVSAYANAGINLPERKTAASAGYDLEAATDVILTPQAVTIVPTGLKAYMPAESTWAFISAQVWRLSIL